MPDPSTPKITKWPFLAADALLLWTAFFVYAQSKLPMGTTELCLAVGCIAAGAVVGIVPFILEYQAVAKLAEADALTCVVTQVRNIEKVAEQISGATARWQNVQDEADKTANAAKTVADKMAEELKAFSEFMQGINDTEKRTLRLEVEKLRRGEHDWLQVLVRMLDHVHALHAGAVRSGQLNLIEQLTHFQNACREAARRVGLVPFSANPAEPFDPQRHQAVDGDGKAVAGALIAGTVATGYTFQGRILRQALVQLQQPGHASPDGAPAEIPGQLALPGTERPDPAP